MKLRPKPDYKKEDAKKLKSDLAKSSRFDIKGIGSTGVSMLPPSETDEKRKKKKTKQRSDEEE